MAATTHVGPMAGQQFNCNVYVADGGFQSIQSAVDYLTEYSSAVGTVYIEPDYTGSDTLASIVRGATTIVIVDRRGGARVPQSYFWYGTEYDYLDFQQGGAVACFRDGIESGIYPPAAATALSSPYPGGWMSWGQFGRGETDFVNVNGTDTSDGFSWSTAAIGAHPSELMALDAEGILAVGPLKQFAVGDIGAGYTALTLNGQLANGRRVGMSSSASDPELYLDTESIFTFQNAPVIFAKLSDVGLAIGNFEGPVSPGHRLEIGDDAGDVVAFVDDEGNASFASVILGGDPVDPLEAATKQYVDDNSGGGGGGMVYPAAGLALSTGTAWGTSIDPATLARVNAANTFAAAQTMGSTLTLNADPAQPLQAATKQYVDAHAGGSMVYPAAGVPQSTGTAWGASIAAANLARTNASNTFNGNQSITGSLTTTDSLGVYTAGFAIAAASNNSLYTSLTFNGQHGDGARLGMVACDQSPDLFIDAPANGHINMRPFGSQAVASFTAMGLSLGTADDATYQLHVTGNVANPHSQICTEGITNDFALIWYKLPNALFQTGASGSGPTPVWYVYDSGPTAGGFLFQVSAPAGDLTVKGNITAATKSFLIPYPITHGKGEPNKTLMHSCLEGPEIGVYYRGEVETSNGVALVTLPEYFEALTLPDQRTVLLTQMYDEDAADPEFAMLMSSQVRGGQFTIRSSTPSAHVSWEVKGVRADVPPLVVVSDTPPPPQAAPTPPDVPPTQPPTIPTPEPEPTPRRRHS